MVKDIGYYKAVNGSKGINSKKDYFQTHTRLSLERDFEHTLDVESFVRWQPDGLHYDETFRLQVNKDNYSEAQGRQLEATALIDCSPLTGYTLYRPELNEYYICRWSFDKSRLYRSLQLLQCNKWLKWLDKDRNVWEYPTYVRNTTQYNSGETSDSMFKHGSTQYLACIQSDENTNILDHGKRFFIDKNTMNPTVYILTQNDNTTLNFDVGLNNLTLYETQYNEDKDNIGLWLCDYYPIPQTTIPINYGKSDQIRIGRSKTLSIDVSDLGNNVSINWSVDTSIEGISYVISEENDKIIIQCSLQEDYIGQTIEVIANIVSDNIDTTSKCILTVVGGV